MTFKEELYARKHRRLLSLSKKKIYNAERKLEKLKNEHVQIDWKLAKNIADQEIKDFWNSKEITYTDCWEWNKSRTEFGYGQTFLGSTVSSAHRVAYKLVSGDVPDQLFVRHTCDNPPCFNPEHLVLGTNADNMQDVRERYPDRKVVTGSGEEHFNSRLTDNMVVELRQRVSNGELVSSIAEEWGINKTTLSRAALGKTWSHVPHPVDPELLKTKGSRHGGSIKLNAIIEEQERTGMKICGSCKDSIPISEFGKNRRLKDGLNRDCLECARRRANALYQKKRAKAI